MADQVASLSIEVSAKTDDARQKLRDLERLGDAFGRKISYAFEDAIFSGESFGTTLRTLATDLSRLALRSAIQPITDGIGGALSGLFSGVTPFAKGGVIGPSMTPFASGGVISSPATFPLGNGRLGLAGEAGPEAILPLARGTDGRLGVRGAGGGGAANVTVNITASDAESFRRSEGQVAAAIARAVSRGQRNL